jgi:hypothetical protein
VLPVHLEIGWRPDQDGPRCDPSSPARSEELEDSRGSSSRRTWVGYACALTSKRKPSGIPAAQAERLGWRHSKEGHVSSTVSNLSAYLSSSEPLVDGG